MTRARNGDEKSRTWKTFDGTSDSIVNVGDANKGTLLSMRYLKPQERKRGQYYSEVAFNNLLTETPKNQKKQKIY